MTERQIMQWYKSNLKDAVDKAIAFKKEKQPDLLYTTDWLLAMAYRETWTLMVRYIQNKIFLENILPIVKGDYNKRPADKEKIFHGYGFWQIDIASYPDFIKSGDWKDPFKCCCKAIDVLEEKRKSLLKHFKPENIDVETWHRMITASYNCGAGNVTEAVKASQSIDSRTHEKNYSNKVWEYRTLYNSLAA